jgi:hypothetical protein
MLLSALIVTTSVAFLPAPLPSPVATPDRPVPPARKALPPKEVPEGGIAGGTPCGCTADLTGDGMIDAADLSILLGQWGGPGSANLDGSGFVSAADLSILLGAWGPCSAPTNDHCNQAISIDPGVHPFCTTNADSDGPVLPGSGGCNLLGYNQIDNDIWYVFLAPSHGTLHVSTCGTDWDTKIALYGSTIPGFNACPSSGISASTFLGCSDDNGGCGLGSDMTITVNADQYYKIRVGGFNDNSGAGQLNVEFTPDGVDCEHSIIIINAEDVTYFGSNAYTPESADGDDCGSGADGHSIWYRFDPPCNFWGGYMTLSTCHPGTDFDTIITLWRVGDHGECAQQLIECNDDADTVDCQISGVGRKSRIDFQPSPGWWYYIQVSGFNNSSGNFELSVKMDSCP